MKEENNTRERLLKAGKEEFLEKGFERASLRKICERAGVTTGAVYFFFENKEDLFHQIVAGTLKQLSGIAQEVMQAELSEVNSSSDSDKIIMEFLWRHRDEIRLLWEKAEGTRYEMFKYEIFSQMEKNFSLFFQKYGILYEDKHLISTLVEMRMKGYMELISKDYPLEEVLRLTDMIGIYADAGFKSLIRELGQQPQQKSNNKKDM